MPTETISGDAGTGVNSGNGWGLLGGYGFNRYVAIEANYGRTKHEEESMLYGMRYTQPANLNSWSGYAKLNFPLTTLDRAQVMSVEPYLKAGVGHYEKAAGGYSNAVKSDGLQYGIGLEVYLFKELSVEADWTTTKVKFNSNDVDMKGDVRTIDVGVVYHFI